MHMLRVKLTSTIIMMGLLASCGNDQKEVREDRQAKVKSTEAVPAIDSLEKNILFFGTSLTAGYGLDPSEAYPSLIQKKIDSLNLSYKVINAGLSGETSAAGRNRIDWLLKQPVSIFVLELGANDGLRGLSVRHTTTNLQAIIDKVKAKYPEVKMVMLGMQMPPNMGVKYTTDFKEAFSRLAEKNDMAYVPFLLEGVGGVASLNQEDGIHPTAEGQKMLAENVWLVLQDLL